MLHNLLKRASAAAVALLLSMFVVFLLLRTSGNPIETSLGDRLSPEELERRIELAGLNRPLYEQYHHYLANLIRLDFGTTFKGEDVGDLIFSHWAATFEVTVSALILLAAVVLFFGALAAWRPGSLLDRVLRSSAVISYALPGFLAAVLLRELTNFLLPSFETSGRLSLMQQIEWQGAQDKSGLVLVDAVTSGNLSLFLDGLSHLVLPALSIVVISGVLVRVFRDSLVFEMSSDEIHSARRRGVPERRVFLRHAFLPALPPVLAGFGITAGSVITGVVFVEKVFEIRGLGYLLVDAVLQREFMLVQGIFVVTFIAVALINLVVDVLIVALDRRQARLLL
jgi:peptide/nickel transport system permease protein